MTPNGIKSVLALLVTFMLLFGLYQPPAVEAAASDSDRMLLFSQANEAFGQANGLLAKDPEAARTLYRKALLRYRKLIEEGVVSGKLYYNIGNTYFRLGELGKAIVNYRRAEQYIPDDENLRQNMAYAFGQRQDKIELREEKQLLKIIFFWHYDLTLPVRAALFALFYIGFWITAASWIRQRNSGPLFCGIAFFLFAAALFCSLIIERRYFREASPGVVVAREIVARKGDGESYQLSFQEPLHEGTEFVLIENRGLWFYIELEDGRRCWIPGSAAEMILLGSREG